MNRIALAYSGVHQIFQLALAAQEMGELDALMCAISSTKGSWGSRLKSWIPDATARPLGSSDISNERIFEHPWPLLASRITRRLLPRRRTDHIITNDWFDRAAEKWLRGRNASIFVGVETCCLRTLKQARSMGMRRVLDCAGIPVQTLDAEANRAAEAFGLQIKPSSNSPRMRAVSERRSPKPTSCSAALNSKGQSSSRTIHPFGNLKLSPFGRTSDSGSKRRPSGNSRKLANRFGCCTSEPSAYERACLIS